jgi:hypothetical protein
MKATPTVIACIAGATTGSTGILVKVAAEPQVIQCHGPGILPFEHDDDLLYYNVRELCNSLARQYAKLEGVTACSPYVTLALSGKTSPRGLEILQSAISDSALGPVPRDQIEWITRGEACFYASFSASDALIVKVGSVAFAHSLMRAPSGQLDGWRVGGWGFLSGDDGGGYYVGRQLLYRLFEEYDGRRNASQFSVNMTQLMGESAEDNISSVTRWIRQHRKADAVRLEVSRLAQIAVYLAEELGDDFCRRLLRRAAHKVASSCLVAAKKIRSDSPDFGVRGIDVVIQGGLVQNSVSFSRELRATVEKVLGREGITHLRFIPLEFTPIVGCIVRALGEISGHCEDISDAWVKQVARHEAYQLKTRFAAGVEEVFLRRRGDAWQQQY